MDRVSDWNNPGSITKRLTNGYFVVDAYDTMGDLLDALAERDSAGDSEPEYVVEHRPLPAGPHIVDLSRELEERWERAMMDQRHRQATRMYA